MADVIYPSAFIPFSNHKTIKIGAEPLFRLAKMIKHNYVTIHKFPSSYETYQYDSILYLLLLFTVTSQHVIRKCERDDADNMCMLCCVKP